MTFKPLSPTSMQARGRALLPALPIRPDVLFAMKVACASAYNAGSQHGLGRLARRAVLSADEAVRMLLGRPFYEIVYTGSRHEAWALGLYGAASARRKKHPACSTLVVVGHTQLERFCVAALVAEGFSVVSAPSLQAALENPEQVAAVALDATTGIAGQDQLTSQLAGVRDTLGVPVVVDLSDFLLGRTLPFHEGNYLYIVGGAEIGGPEAVAALAKPKGLALEPLYGGGGQMGGMRSGTEAIVAIAGLGSAARACAEASAFDVQATEAIKVALRALSVVLGAPLFWHNTPGFLEHRYFFVWSPTNARPALPKLRAAAQIVVARIRWEDLCWGLASSIRPVDPAAEWMVVTWHPSLCPSLLVEGAQDFARALGQRKMNL